MKRFLFILFLTGSFCLPTFTSGGEKPEVPKNSSDADTWAHLALSGDELFIRELNALAVHRWQTPKK